MMKVLWIMNKELDTASDRAYIAELSKALSAENVETEVVARYKKEKINYGVKINYVQTSKYKKLNLLIYLVKLPVYIINRNIQFKPNIIVIDRPLLVYPILIVLIWFRLKRVKTKIVIDIRSLPTSRIRWKITQFIMFDLGLKLAGLFFDGCLVITEPMKKYVKKIAGFEDRNFGIWTSAFNECVFNPETTICNEKMKTNGKVNLIYHGAIAANRNLIELVEAMQYLPSDFLLLLLGEGPLIKTLREKVMTGKLESKVEFLPPVAYSQVPAYLMAADIGIVPIPDTFWFRVSSPIKLLEYMAMGLPVVAPEIEPVTNVAQKNTDILFYKLHNSNLSEEIALTITTCYEKWGKNYFSKRNRNAVIENFTWQKQAKTIKSFFMIILSKKRESSIVN